MRYVKILGLLAVAAAALMAIAGTTSANVTSPPGTNYKGGEIVATSTNAQLDGTVGINCLHSEIAIELDSATSGTIRNLTFTGCNRTVTPEYFIDIFSGKKNYGTLSVNSEGTIRSSWVKFTVQTTILGFPVHCIYKTSITDLGTLTEGIAPATMHIGSAPIPQEATSSACGNDAVWTGTYTVKKPISAITVDS